MQPISKGQQGGAMPCIKVPAPLESFAMNDEVLDGLGFKPAWKLTDNDDKVMSWLLLCNKLHLHQTWETPCARGPIKDYISNYSLGVGAQDILEGNFDTNLAENLLALKQWLKHHIRRVAA
eukprot:116765-Ditylum_brightwellii.AAC.2